MYTVYHRTQLFKQWIYYQLHIQAPVLLICYLQYTLWHSSSLPAPTAKVQLLGWRVTSMGLDSQGARPTDTTICSDRGACLLSHPWKHLVLVDLEHLFTKTMILQWAKSTHRLKYTEIILILIQQTYSRPRNLIFSRSPKWFILMRACFRVEFLVEHQCRQCTGDFWQNPKSRSRLHGQLTSSCLSS